MPVELAPLTTLRVGGPAAVLWECTSTTALVEALREAPDAFVLGGGSNVVLPDAGLDQVVLVRSSDSDGLTVAAGIDWDAFVAQTLADGFVGLEALSGIPGTVGASPIQNIGAYGAEVATSISSVRVWDRSAAQVVDLTAAECGFAYRTSDLKASGRWAVLSVTFSLVRGTASAPVRYAELADLLGIPIGSCAPAFAVRDAVLHLRAGKGMVLSEDDPDSVSVGSFFTNPLVHHAPEGAPSWPAESGLVKVSAAWLIEQSGFTKGWGTGRVGLSSKHALALVNRGGATAADVLACAREVRSGVRDRFGIALENEPVIVGDVL